MKQTILLLVPTFLFFIGFSQNWKEKDYQKWNQSNFRKCRMLHEKFYDNKIDYPLLNACIFYLTNEVRIGYGLKKLDYNIMLERTAFEHSREMANRNFFSHENPYDTNRLNCTKRANLSGISNPYIAENIAISRKYYIPCSYLQRAAKIVAQWMNSPHHRDNILSPTALTLGCGTFVHAGDIYATQDFQWYEPIRTATKQSGTQLYFGK